MEMVRIRSYLSGVFVFHLVESVVKTWPLGVFVLFALVHLHFI